MMAGQEEQEAEGTSHAPAVAVPAPFHPQANQGSKFYYHSPTLRWED